MVPALFAHQAPGFQALGFSPGLTLYLTVALLGLLALSLRVSWVEPRFPEGAVAVAGDGPAGPRSPGGGVGRVLPAILQGLGLALLVFLLACGWAGSAQPGPNPIANAVFWVFWIGGQLAAAVIGDWWQLVNPFATIARWVSRAPAAAGGADDDAEEDDGWWIPAVLLFSFLWLWLCWLPDGTRPRNVATWLTAYTVVMIVGAGRSGPGWIRRNEAFGVVFGLIAACSPVTWTGGWRPHLRNPLVGIAAKVIGRRELAVLAVMLGAALFDAVGTSLWFANLVGLRSKAETTAFFTFGLLWLIVTVALVWIGATRLAVLLAAPHEIEVELGDQDRDSLEADRDEVRRAVPYRLAAPLALVAAGFAVSHESANLLVYSQNLLAQISDPFAQSWNLFGTGANVVDPNFPSAGAQAWISLVLIEVPLLGAFAALHDRALAVFGREGGAQASWAMLGFAVVAAIAALKVLLGV